MEILNFKVVPGTHLGRQNERGNFEIALVGEDGRTVERVLSEHREKSAMLEKLKAFKVAGKPVSLEKQHALD